MPFTWRRVLLYLEIQLFLYIVYYRDGALINL